MFRVFSTGRLILLSKATYFQKNTIKQVNNMASSVRISFLGAAMTVTGSKYLIETDKRKVLVDCGLFQGRKELRLRNWDSPNFDPRSLDAIVLTHGHIDHTGSLPVLVRLGFKAPIYCTPATKELLSLLLPDSARLQEEEARHANANRTSKHDPAKPLYTEQEAQRALALLQVIPRDQATELFPGFAVTPSCAGHILGATSLSFDIDGRRLTFSGDIGRFKAPILPDPQPLSIGDLLVCESTYGNRDHPDIDSQEMLGASIRAAAAKGGPIIIPAFALGRTQDLLFHIGELERAGAIPVLPVFVDSPMAVDATSIYKKYQNDFDSESAALLAAGHTPLRTERTTFVRSVWRYRS
jgi:metallo-beta-lactamase family protein